MRFAESDVMQNNKPNNLSGRSLVIRHRSAVTRSRCARRRSGWCCS
jgi:hypothetical protein